MYARRPAAETHGVLNRDAFRQPNHVSMALSLLVIFKIFLTAVTSEESDVLRWACLFACLSVRSHISITAHPTFAQFSVRVERGSGSVFLWRRCDKLISSGVCSVTHQEATPKPLECLAFSVFLVLLRHIKLAMRRLLAHYIVHEQRPNVSKSALL